MLFRSAADLTVAGTLASVANLSANVAVGGTGRSGISTPPHATTWQHKLGSWLSRQLGSPTPGTVGKLAGRAAYLLSVGTLLFEGGYDAQAMVRCGAKCAENPCANPQL